MVYQWYPTAILSLNLADGSLRQPKTRTTLGNQIKKKMSII